MQVTTCPGTATGPSPPAGSAHGPDLADDVWERVAVVVVPRALGGNFSVDEVADGLLRQSAAAKADVDAVAAPLAVANPRWTTLDARGVARRQRPLRRRGRRLAAPPARGPAPLVVDCPVPGAREPVSPVVADGPETATVAPARSLVLAGPEAARVVAIRGAHGLHRDRPGLFLLAVLELTPDLS